MVPAFYGVLCAIPVATIVGVALAWRRPLADFRCAGGAFVARARPHLTILWFGLALLFLTVAPSYLAVAGGLRWFGLVVFGLLGLIYLWLGAGNVTNRSRVLIRTDGVVVRARFARHFVPWTALGDAGALLDAGLRSPLLPMRRNIQDVVTLGSLDVEPRRVLSAIAYYRDHPEARAEIGSPAELARIPASGPDLVTTAPAQGSADGTGDLP